MKRPSEEECLKSNCEKVSLTHEQEQQIFQEWIDQRKNLLHHARIITDQKDPCLEELTDLFLSNLEYFIPERLQSDEELRETVLNFLVDILIIPTDTDNIPSS